MAKLIILMGNIGTGKTTFRKKNFINGEIHICPDDFVNETSNDRYEKTVRVVRDGLKNGYTVVLEGIFMSKKSREFYIFYAKQVNGETVIYDLGKGDDTTLQRRINERPDVDSSIWIKNHHENRKLYEKPTIDEGFYEIITL